MYLFADYTATGWTVGLILLIVFLIIGLFVAVPYGVHLLSSDRKSGIVMITTGIIWSLLVFGVWLWASWPLRYEYHHYVEKTGVVQKVSNRLVSGGEGIVNQRFVFVINGSPYGVDDTRASLAHVGDSVRLFCKKEHEFGQQYLNDGWACRWGGSFQ